MLSPNSIGYNYKYQKEFMTQSKFINNAKSDYNDFSQPRFASYADLKNAHRLVWEKHFIAYGVLLPDTSQEVRDIAFLLWTTSKAASPMAIFAYCLKVAYALSEQVV
jgi:hypothetical protein